MIAIVGIVLLYRQSLKPKAEIRVASGAPSLAPQDAPGDSIGAQIRELEAMWQKHPVHAPIALQLGNLQAEAHNHAEAIKYYRAFLELDTARDAWEIRLDIAKELYLMGMSDSSRMELLAAAADHPDHPGVLYNLGALAANGSDTVSARRHWNRLLTVAPSSPEAENARAGLARLEGK